MAVCALLVGCFRQGGTDPDPGSDPDGGTTQPPDDGGGSSMYPAPRTDVVPRVGGDGSLDVATWNLEFFPLEQASPRLVADLIASLDLDLIAVQEIASTSGFQELIDRLPDHEGILSSDTYSDGTYQKIGFIYRADLMDAGPPTLVFQGDGYEFPRPALQVTFTADDGDHPPVSFVAISVHLKAGFGSEDGHRRELAIQMLDDYTRQMVDGSGDDDVILLGDFNEEIDDAEGQARFAPFLSAPDRYDVRTGGLASAGEVSFIPSQVMLDHVISTIALEDEFSGGDDVIPHLDDQFGSYVSSISDHLPVVAKMPIFQ